MRANGSILRNVLTASLFVCALFAESRSIAGHREGNGGDHIRATYFKVGTAVIRHLQTNVKGQQIVRNHGLNVGELEDTLDINVVKVVLGPLIDNGGSKVDALGQLGNVTLDHAAWFEHFEKEHDIYYLVFHEMLRAVGIDDDNFTISGALLPFPAKEKIPTSINNAAPLIEEDNLARYFDLTAPTMNGNGCPNGFETFMDFDQSTNEVGLKFSGMELFYDRLSPLTESRKSCTFGITVKNIPPNKRLVVNQIDTIGDVNIPRGASIKSFSEVYMQGQASQSVNSKTLSATNKPIVGKTLLRSRGGALVMPCGFSDRAIQVRLSINASADPNGETTIGRIGAAKLAMHLEDCR